MHCANAHTKKPVVITDTRVIIFHILKRFFIDLKIMNSSARSRIFNDHQHHEKLLKSLNEYDVW